MPGIIVPRRKIWKRQPQRPVSIDRSNPICRGLFAAKCGALSYGFSRFAAPTAVGVPGISITNPVATDLYSPLDVPVTSSEWTLFCLAITPNIPSYNSAWGLYGGTSARIHQHFRVYAGATGADCRPYAPDSSSGWNFPINTVVPFATVISGSGNFIKHYANKVKNSSATLSSTSAITVNTAEFFAKSLTNTDQASINTKLFVCIAWSRALSDREIVAISENPWQIFKPRTRRTIIDLGASGGALNAAASGSDTASGSATLAAQVALAGVGVSVAGGSAQAGAAVPLSAAGITVAGGSANGTATVSITAAGLAQAAGQAGLSASVLLAAAGAAQASGNATLAAQLNALASGAAQASGSANLSGGAPGALSASGGDVASGSAVLSVSVQLQATGAGQAGGSANGTASAPGAISATGQANASGFASWSALVTLTAAGFVQAMGAGSFTATIPLQATGAARASGTANASLAGVVHNFQLDAVVERITRAIAAVLPTASLACDAHRRTTLIHEVRHA